MVWAYCLPPCRLISVEVVKPQMPNALRLFEDRNNLGRVISGCVYWLCISSFPQWSRALLYVCHESHQAYRARYRMSLPLFRNLPDEQDSLEMVHLCPDTDIIQLTQSVPEFDDDSSGTFSVLPFLYDCWAHDPKGAGIVHLAFGAASTQWSPMVNRPRRPMAEVKTLAMAIREFLANKEIPSDVVQTVRSYFASFGKTHTLYIILPMHGSAVRQYETLRFYMAPGEVASVETISIQIPETLRRAHRLRQSNEEGPFTTVTIPETTIKVPAFRVSRSGVPYLPGSGAQVDCASMSAVCQTDPRLPVERRNGDQRRGQNAFASTGPLSTPVSCSTYYFWSRYAVIDPKGHPSLHTPGGDVQETCTE